MAENEENHGNRNVDVETVLGLNQNATSLFSRRWLFTVGVFVAGLIGLYSYLIIGGSGDSVQYITEPASRNSLTVIVTATGTVQPTNQVDVSSELSGTIRTVNVDYNSKVEAGQVLAELDTDKLKASVASSEAKLAAARARVKSAEAARVEASLEHERKRQLADQKIATAHDLEAARSADHRAAATLESAVADVNAAVADLQLNKTTMDKACICSPISGIVLKRNVEPGQTVASSLQAPILFNIAEDLTRMEVQVDVDEADVGKVKVGQNATFSVDAHPDLEFKAILQQLYFGSEVVQGVVTYKAILTTDNSKLLLRPGMTATAEIVVKSVEDALTVPNAALRYLPPSANKTVDNRNFLQKLFPGRPQMRPPSAKDTAGPERDVWILVDGEAKKLAIVIGSTDGRRTEIVKGNLLPGQEVIVDTAAGGT